MTVLTYAYPDFTSYTKIVSAEVNSKFTSIATVLNGTAVLPRAILANGTANHVIINNGSGAPSSEAQLAKSRGGTGYDLTTQPLELPAIVTPSTPAAGFGRIYMKSDGFLYQLNDAGTETKVGTGSGGSSNYVTNPDAESTTTGWATYSSSVTATITIASPAVITVASTTGYAVGDPVVFTTTGALPTGLSSGTTYYISSVVSGTTYKVSATLGGSDVNTSGSQSGTHSAGLARPISGSGGSATATWTRSTSSPLRGTANFLFTHGNTGDGVSYDFTIDKADQARILNISFDYNLSSTITDGDYTVWVYDVTNAVKIQPSPYKISSLSSSLNGKFTGTFQTASSSTSYRLCFHQSNVSSVNIKADNVVVGPQIVEYGAPITDYTQYTLTLGASTSAPTKGTVVTDKAFWRRVGDSWEFMWHYEQSAAGSAGTGTYLIPLPAGLTIDTTKTNTDTSGQSAAALGTGYVEVNNGTNNNAFSVFAYDTTHLALINGPDAGATAWGSTYYALSAANTSKISVSARVPILGWGSSVVMSNDSDTRVVAARAYAPSTLGVTNVTAIAWPTTDFDSHGCLSGGRYTAPVPGYYRIVGELFSGGSINVMIYKNGVAISEGTSADATSPAIVADTFKLVAGDIVDIRTNATTTLNTGTGNVNRFTIERLSGPASIAASESVTLQAGKIGVAQSISNTTITTIASWDTASIDSHGGFNSTSGVYTVQTPGKYSCTAIAAFASNSTGFRMTRISQNGNAMFEASVAAIANDGGATVSGILNCLAGDTISIGGFQNSGGSLSTSTATGYVRLSITRIGN